MTSNISKEQVFAVAVLLGQMILMIEGGVILSKGLQHQNKHQHHSHPKHKHHSPPTINIVQQGDYLIAVQDNDTTATQPNHIGEESHRRQKRNSDFKYHVKAKGLISGKYHESSKRNSVHLFESEKTAVVDLLVVVDYSAYQQALVEKNYNREKTRIYMQEYYKLLVSLINARYAEIEATDLKITINPADIFVLEKEEDSEWVESIAYDWHEDPYAPWERVVDPKELLDSFSTWLTDNKHHLPKHDHAMTFIGHRLVRRGRDSPSSGMAYVNTICQTQHGFSCSVIHETWGFGNAGAAAHELGHSLGATHDGLEENKECPANHGYLMAPTSSPQENLELNFFSFSECSIRAFKKTISSRQGECLHAHSKPVTDLLLEELKTRPGDWITPDKQCKQVFGEQSGQCKIRNLQEPGEICHRLWCDRPMDDGRLSCASRGGLHAVYGTKCGRDQICYNGRCIEESIMNHGMNLHERLMDSASQNLDHLRMGLSLENEHSNEHISAVANTDNDISKDNVLLKQKPVKAVVNNAEETQVPRTQPSESSENFNNDNELYKRIQELLSRKHTSRKHGHRKHTTTDKTTAATTTRKINTTQRPTTTTETTTMVKSTPPTAKTTTTDRHALELIAGCVEDTDPHYCRRMVYSHRDACSHANIREYCCYSCGFYA